jgi:hypothetical protein
VEEAVLDQQELQVLLVILEQQDLKVHQDQQQILEQPALKV